MIVAIHKEIPQKEIQQLKQHLEQKQVQVRFSSGENYDLLILSGDLSRIDEKMLLANDWVESVQRIAAPYKLASRITHPEDTVVNVKGIRIGAQEDVVIIAGPCSVETPETMEEIVGKLKTLGVPMLRAGAYKPRTSPYSFQGLEEEGLSILQKVGQNYQMPIISEITKVSELGEFAEKVDIIQIGARNMQNFELLKALGETTKPILLKRGMGNTIEEWLMSAEYILSAGNPNVILCERGIRTFETSTRSTLDLSAIPVLREKTHLPVVVDPSHATGNWKWVESMSLAALAAGADGLLIEVHSNPEAAWSDGQQSLKIDRFGELLQKAKLVVKAIGRKLYEG